MVRLLLQLGVDADSPDAPFSDAALKGTVWRTPIATAASNSFNENTWLQTMDILSKRGCDVNALLSTPLTLRE